ncbi:MarC family protein [bacterium SCSIO 12741]|nr:MarC family protein [bacterium SCSIO 12741]
MTESLLNEFTTLFAVIDPVGTFPVFLAATALHSKAESRKIAFRAALIAGLVLLFFALAGQGLLEYLEIPLLVFQISGGVILFMFALTMIFGESKPEDEINHIEKKKDIAVYPIAIPSIASPGAIMAIVLLTDTNRHSWDEQFVTIGLMLVVLGITLALMLLAGWLKKIIGDSGATIISRIMGLLLAAMAANFILSGLKEYF